MGDPLRDLALFFEVAKAGSFTQAAAALDMPNSTLSRRVIELEARLGVRLLDRSTRKLALTEAGTAYLERCERIMNEARLAQEEIAVLADKPAGRLRVSVSADIGSMFLAPIVASFAKVHPDISFELDLNPARVDLLTERFDVAIRVGPLPDSTLTARRVFEIPSALAAAPAYLDASKTVIRPSELGVHACLPLPHDHGKWSLTKDGEIVEVSVSGRFATNNMTMVRRLAKAGFGIAALPKVTIAKNEAAGLLKPVLSEWTLTPVKISALTVSRHLPAKTRLFLDFLTDNMAAHLTGA